MPWLHTQCSAGHNETLGMLRDMSMQGLPRCLLPKCSPMSTGEALATLPTSSSDCIIFLMRACRLALTLPLAAILLAAVPSAPLLVPATVRWSLTV